MRRRATRAALAIPVVIGIGLLHCGDDTVDPSNPDASASKVATTEAGPDRSASEASPAPGDQSTNDGSDSGDDGP
jgi:hypothetical protein